MTNVQTIIKFFGTKRELARLLECKPQALTRWEREGIPANAAIKIEKLSKGKFKAINIPLYVTKNKAA